MRTIEKRRLGPTICRTWAGDEDPTGDRGRGRGRGRGGGRDRGGATICLLAVGLLFVVSGLFGAGVGAARAARQQARVAADFGALAGAARALQDESTVCARAGEIVVANAARLVRCRLDGLDVLVTAEVTVEPLPGMIRVATATARAGPIRATEVQPASSAQRAGAVFMGVELPHGPLGQQGTGSAGV